MVTKAMTLTDLRRRLVYLVELVMTLVVAAVLGIMSVQFIRSTSEGFISSNGREQLAAAGYVVNEQISRGLRDALPGGIRTTADGLCVEYMPVVAASMYDLSVNSAVTHSVPHHILYPTVRVVTYLFILSGRLTCTPRMIRDL